MIIVFGYLDTLFFSEHFKFKYNYEFTIKVYVVRYILLTPAPCRVRSHNFSALSLDWCCAASLLLLLCCCAASLLLQPDLGTDK